MASQDHIRNPIEWGWDQILLAALTVGSLGRSLRGSEESHLAPLPAVARIKTTDLRDALMRGLEDFEAYRTDVIFLCLIYPVVGIAVAWLTFGHEMLPLLFPLASGFALVGPVAAVGLYEMSRRREQGIRITWADAFRVVQSPAFGAILALGLILVTIFLLWLLTANLIYQFTLGPEQPASITAFARDVFTTQRGLGNDRDRAVHWFPLRPVGAGDQRGVVSAVAGPRCWTSHRSSDVDPSCGGEPRPDGCLGPDRRRQPIDRVNTRVPWSHLCRAHSRARHLASVP